MRVTVKEKCSACSSEGPHPVKHNGPHLQLDCVTCGAYMRFLSKREFREIQASSVAPGSDFAVRPESKIEVPFEPGWGIGEIDRLTRIHYAISRAQGSYRGKPIYNVLFSDGTIGVDTHKPEFLPLELASWHKAFSKMFADMELGPKFYIGQKVKARNGQRGVIDAIEGAYLYRLDGAVLAAEEKPYFKEHELMVPSPAPEIAIKAFDKVAKREDTARQEIGLVQYVHEEEVALVTWPARSFSLEPLSLGISRDGARGLMEATAYKAAIPLALAEEKARILAKLTAPHSMRYDICGSVRRRKATVGDIEILCIPNPVTDLLGEPVEGTHEMLEFINKELAAGRFTKRLNKTGFPIGVGPAQACLLWDDIPVDFFFTTREQWGVAKLIRTGSADFSRKFARPKSEGGYLEENQRLRGWRIEQEYVPLDTPEEEDVFHVCGVDWIEPEDRS